jgi:SNF2 family DNA or RNA helicase
VTLYNEISDLEARRLKHLSDAESKRQEIARLINDLDGLEKQEKKQREQVKKLQREQDQEQRREESLEQAGQVRSDVARLEKKYRELAQGHPWYNGNGDVDPIFPFQWRGALFGAGARRWILGDGMGLGKTRQSIGWLDLVVRARKVLVVCQADICDQFAGEIMTLAPHRNVVNLYKKTPKTRHALMEKVLASDDAVVVVNFEIWRKDKDLLAKLMDWQIDT